MTKRGSIFRGMSAGFVEAVRKFPDRPGLEVAGQTLTYKDGYLNEFYTIDFDWIAWTERADREAAASIDPSPSMSTG